MRRFRRRTPALNPKQKALNTVPIIKGKLKNFLSVSNIVRNFYFDFVGCVFVEADKDPKTGLGLAVAGVSIEILRESGFVNAGAREGLNYFELFDNALFRAEHECRPILQVNFLWCEIKDRFEKQIKNSSRLPVSDGAKVFF